jgi:GntR family transcriptional repressor for pyruvate dehydrogenase complex
MTRDVSPPAAGRPRLSTIVRDRLLAEIRAGVWQPGDRLPTEPELEARFGVSRTPVREAMQSLRLMGVVDISPRRGTTLRSIPSGPMLEFTLMSGTMDPQRSIADIIEFRLVVESATTSLCAERASVRQLAGIRTLLTRNAAAATKRDPALVQRIDVEFHAAIAAGAGNPVFQSAIQAVSDLLANLRRVTGGTIPGASMAALAEHEAIYDAVVDRDGPRARSAAERHITNTYARYRRSLQELDAAQRPAGAPVPRR